MKGVGFRISLKLVLQIHGPIDLSVWDLFLLRQPVSEYHDSTSMKEIEYSVIDTLKSHPEFMNAIPESVGIGAVEFMPEGHQSFNPFKALFSGLLLKTFDPLDHRNRSVVVFVKYDSHWWQRFVLREFLSRNSRERSSGIRRCTLYRNHHIAGQNQPISLIEHKTLGVATRR
jgi:hypothetical protein